MSKIKNMLALFWAFFKIGLFTFGGGYAMIPVIERELVERKKWIEQTDFIDLIAIAESTPGPLAVNSATYIGYKRLGILGSISATLGVVLPSFIIIFIISLFFTQFLALKFVNYAFKGIQACVVYLILSAGIKMLKSIKKGVFNYTLVILTIVLMIVLDLFAKNISTIFYILIGGGAGVLVYSITALVNKIKTQKNKKDGEN